jgi:hypothetical protein
MGGVDGRDQPIDSKPGERETPTLLCGLSGDSLAPDLFLGVPPHLDLLGIVDGQRSDAAISEEIGRGGFDEPETKAQRLVEHEISVDPAGSLVSCSRAGVEGHLFFVRHHPREWIEVRPSELSETQPLGLEDDRHLMSGETDAFVATRLDDEPRHGCSHLGRPLCLGSREVLQGDAASPGGVVLE